HAGVVHIVAADGVAAAQAFEAGQLLLRLTQRGLGRFSPGHRHGVALINKYTISRRPGCVH
ncbi:hypothetical protein, partial [Enterobacter intestinihominis]